MPKNSVMEVGKKYGRLTVIKENGRDRHGHKIYQYRCDCGNIGYGISSFLLSGNNIRCKKCSEKEIGQSQRIDILEKTINGFEILREVGKDENGQLLFLCRCVCCGVEKIKTKGSIRFKNKERCINCPPNYNFTFEGDYAVGILPNRTHFRVDKESVPAVSKIHWHRKSNGYIVSKTRHQPTKYLHRYVLGIDDDSIIDHINRDKTDCRNENLRVCSTQQNAWNKGLQSNNTTGYVGVTYISKRNSYMSRIGLNNKYFTIGTYKDIITAAQAHNIAAEFFYGEYMGHMNDVPQPAIEFKWHIIEKCKKILAQFETVENQRVSFSFPDAAEVIAF